VRKICKFARGIEKITWLDAVLIGFAQPSFNPGSSEPEQLLRRIVF